MRLSLLAGLLLCAACGDATTSSTLQVSPASAIDPGAVEARWRYQSGEVDVDIRLKTKDEVPCASVARVVIDKALASAAVYSMPDTECDVLRIEPDGDLVLFDSTTGHDWSSEPLDVDTDREQIRLGPWRDPDSGTVYAFVLSAPECDDDSGCDCPMLERRAGSELLTLELARMCD